MSLDALWDDVEWAIPMVSDARSTHTFSASVQEERCSCGEPAAHKVGEEITNPQHHNLTNYVCCEHFTQFVGHCGGLT